MPASILAGAGMRRHLHTGHGAAESFVSFIRLFDRSFRTALVCLVARPTLLRVREPHEYGGNEEDDPREVAATRAD